MNESLQQHYRGVFDGRLGFGNKPAALVVDFIRAYTTPGSPLFAGPVCDAVMQTMDMLAAARAKGVLLIYTQVLYNPNGLDGGKIWWLASRWPRSCRNSPRIHKVW